LLAGVAVGARIGANLFEHALTICSIERSNTPADQYLEDLNFVRATPHTTTTTSPAPPPSAWLGGHGGPAREEPGSERTWLDTMVAKKPGEARESPVGCGQRARKEPGNVPKSPISRASRKARCL